MELGERIKELRTIKGYSQQKLGELVGFVKSTADVRIVHYEKGQRTPKPATLEKIAQALEVNPSVLVRVDPIERAVQEVFWLTPEQRLEVAIALEELEKKEDLVEWGKMSKNELTLWKLKWKNNQQEESEWN